MQIIVHRRNTRYLLTETPKNYGIEVDIRSKGEQLIIHHDAFAGGESFENWLMDFKHKTLILNVKEEGLEDKVLNLMQSHHIEDFFFLDQSFPFLIKTSQSGERRCAVRISEYESIDTALSLAGKIDWVWVDCFSKFPLSTTQAIALKKAGFKICIVSPELQGRHDRHEISNFARLLSELEITIDAVCTKNPELWQ